MKTFSLPSEMYASFPKSSGINTIKKVKVKIPELKFMLNFHYIALNAKI